MNKKGGISMPFEQLITDQLVNNSLFAVLSASLLVYTLKTHKEEKVELHNLLKEQGSKLAEISQVLSSLVARLDIVEVRMEERNRKGD